MKRLNLVVLIFGSALLLFLYQNCQKATFNQQNDSSNDGLSLPNLDYKYKSISMSGSGGYMACMERCLTSGQISINLETAKLTVKGSWMGEVLEAPTRTSAASPPVLENPNVTDFELSLSAGDLEILRAATNSLDIVDHVIPACDPCMYVMDMPHVMHTLKDYNDIEKDVYLYNYIDPNISNVTVGAYASATELNDLACKIKQKVDSSNLNSSLKADTVAIIRIVTHLNLDRSTCL